jgi:hypothetical protein
MENQSKKPNEVNNDQSQALTDVNYSKDQNGKAQPQKLSKIIGSLFISAFLIIIAIVIINNALDTKKYYKPYRTLTYLNDKITAMYDSLRNNHYKKQQYSYVDSLLTVYQKDSSTRVLLGSSNLYYLKKVQDIIHNDAEIDDKTVKTDETIYLNRRTEIYDILNKAIMDIIPWYICPIPMLFYGCFILILVYSLAKYILAPGQKFRKFFVGEKNMYSISRLQAVLWAWIIISAQISVLLLLYLFKETHEFILVFSDETMWLLGLSLFSYVSIKGICTKSSEKDLIYTKNEGISNFILGENGLDFSKFQMLVWTLFAMIIFIVSCQQYLWNIMMGILNHNLNPLKFNLSALFLSDYQYLPKISMSFIILMGLSQGGYIGKASLPLILSSKSPDSPKGNVESIPESANIKKDIEEMKKNFDDQISSIKKQCDDFLSQKEPQTSIKRDSRS